MEITVFVRIETNVDGLLWGELFIRSVSIPNLNTIIDQAITFFLYLITFNYCWAIGQNNLRGVSGFV